MKCACGRNAKPGDAFCSGCGNPLAGSSNTISTGGGPNYGSQFQAGRDLYVSQSTPTHSEGASYEAIPKWRTPFTQAVLTWIGFVTGIGSLFPLGKVFEPLVDTIRLGAGVSTDYTHPFMWLTIFIILIVIAALALSGRAVAKKQLRVPVIRGWAVSGQGKRLTVERIKAGKCPKCHGQLKYYNKAVEWTTRHGADGKEKREVTKKKPALECKRNPDHFFWVDIAEGAES